MLGRVVESSLWLSFCFLSTTTQKMRSVCTHYFCSQHFVCTRSFQYNVSVTIRQGVWFTFDTSCTTSIEQ
uniref:Putative secreted protein n=1 Tax=Ixodes ricinus TaxID=34613 RepID=A0A6B0U1N6_IXORI